MKLSIRALRWGAAGLFLLMLRTPADADPYVIGPEDVLDISVWEHPELSMTTRVDQEGFLVLPPIGDVRASGKTPNDLARHLEDVLQTFLRQRVQVTVTVTGYNSRRIGGKKSLMALASGAARPSRSGRRSSGCLP